MMTHIEVLFTSLSRYNFQAKFSLLAAEGKKLVSGKHLR